MLNLNEKEIYKVIANSIVLGFYEKKLLTDSEFFAICKDLKLDGNPVDIITLMSDICNEEE